MCSSGTNTQPWEVAVVSGKRKEELSNILYEMSKSGVARNPDIQSPEAWPHEMDIRAKKRGEKRLKILGIKRDDQQRRKELGLSNYEFYGAPCVLFLFMDSALSSWSIFDMGLMAQSIILAAHSFGLGSCIQALICNYPDAIRKYLEIPKTKLLVVGISMGYPALEARINTYQSDRNNLGDFAWWYP
ncbi:nitroreductase [Chloroflexota bacterium]